MSIIQLYNSVKKSSAHRLIFALARGVEVFLFGGRLRESVGHKLLALHYKSLYRRQWLWRHEPPHFFSHRVGLFSIFFTKTPAGVESLYRSFYSALIVRKGDVLLDIGCGDGFFAKYFCSVKCRHIDAIDVEPTAIHAAEALCSADNITYHLRDAVAQPFPLSRYDVIVWDGAIGHFPPETTEIMLKKISKSLQSNGIFTGSESLGSKEGEDHLQFFESIKDLEKILKKHFKYVSLHNAKYMVGRKREFERNEAYWRCSNSLERLEADSWTKNYR
ncbi:MAG TPA: class I SAM-dependent methyltransferase [Bacteroidota bacterium]|nr:class I SAM-dependent methyltransferase [Bacteroidota bacterium]